MKSLDEAVTFASEIEAMEKAEDRKQARVVRATDIPSAAEVSAINNQQTNRVLERIRHIIEQNTAMIKEMLSAMQVNGNVACGGGRAGRTIGQNKTGSACYNCGKIGHFIANCPGIQTTELNGPTSVEKEETQ